MGSAKIFSLLYKVSNLDEPAYLTELKISLAYLNTSSSVISFAIIPPGCTENDLVLTCELIAGNSINQGDSIEFMLSVDMSHASGSNLEIVAEVSSFGTEKDGSDNVVAHSVMLISSSEIDLNG